MRSEEPEIIESDDPNATRSIEAEYYETERHVLSAEHMAALREGKAVVLNVSDEYAVILTAKE